MRKMSLPSILTGVGIVLMSSLSVYPIDTNDTALLTQPAISAKAIAFVYANDLWTADLDGRNVRRLTTDIGREVNPDHPRRAREEPAAEAPAPAVSDKGQ